MRFVKVSGMLLLCCAGAAMAQGPTFQPVGTVRQVMLGIVKPTSDVVFKFQFDPPKTDEEWMTLRNNALNLAEAGNLLLLPGRAKDKGEWTKNAKALIATDRGFKCRRLPGLKRPWSLPPALGQAKARKRGKKFGDWRTRRAMDVQWADSGSTCW